MYFNRPLSLPKYTSDDCVKMVKDFFEANGRVPTQEDIRALSKKNKGPSWRVFTTYGGLNHIIMKAGLTPNRRESKK